MIVNDDFFMKLIFKKYYVKEYGKQYEMNRKNTGIKKKVNHIIFSNIHLLKKIIVITKKIKNEKIEK